MSVDSSAAEVFAARVVRLYRLVAEQEGADMVQVGTGELCKAMGRPAGASMEQVKAFVCRLLPLLEAEGLSAACGCGFLALQVVPFSVLETALADERELVTFAPPDIDAYLEKAESSGLSPRSDISPTT